MIERVTAYKASNGQTFEKIEDVQKFEVSLVLAGSGREFKSIGLQNVCDEIAGAVLENKDKILDILTTGPRSKPKARAINGGRKARTPKVTMTPDGKGNMKVASNLPTAA